MAHVDLYSEALVSSHFKQVSRTFTSHFDFGLYCVGAGTESRIQRPAWTSKLSSS